MKDFFKIIKFFILTWLVIITQDNLIVIIDPYNDFFYCRYCDQIDLYTFYFDSKEENLIDVIEGDGYDQKDFKNAIEAYEFYKQKRPHYGGQKNDGFIEYY